MKNWLLLSFFIAFSGLSLSSCKSEFEKIRASGDADKIYKEAYKYYEEGEYLKAQTLFELIIGGLRGKVEAEKVYFYYAYTHYYLKKYVSSAYYFKNFSTTFPNSEFREEADYMVGFSNYELSPNFRLDQSYSAKAIDAFQLFVNTYPQSERVEKCNLLIDELRRKLERKAYDEGQLYFDLRQYQAATASFENLLRDYPETTNAENIRFMMAKACFLLAKNSIYEKRSERYEQALKYADIFIEKYPGSGFSGEIRSIKSTAVSQINKLNNKS